MKKLNWKLLLVLALALILVLAFVACNNKTNSNNPTPPSPSNQNLVGDQATQALLNELLAVSKNIGNQPVSDNDAFVNLDFSLNLGSRPDPTSAPLSLFSLGFKIQGVLDRTNNNNSNSTALNIAVSASDQDNNSVDVFNAFFQASDNSLYLTLGNQKVKMNVSLAQDLFSSLFSNLASSKGLSDFLALTGENFSLQSVVDFFVGDKTIDPHGMIGVILDAVGALSPEGKIDIEGIVSSETIYKLLKSTKTGNHYNATLADDMAPMVSGFLNADTAKGDDVLVNISFDSDNNHHLQNGLSISLDTVVGEANPFYNQVALKYGNTPSFPFVQLTLNSLNIAPASTSNSPSLPNGDYKDNLQFQADVNLSLTGISIGMAPEEATPAKDLHLGLYADLDLVNKTDNKTAVRMFINFKNNPLQDKTPYDRNAFDLVYKNGRLSMKIDNDAQLLGLPGVIGVNYGLVLAGSIGNMIDGILTGEAKELFDAQYWIAAEYGKYAYGDDSISTGGAFNPNFKGMVIDGLDVNTIFKMLSGKSASAAEEVPAPAAEEESKGESNIFNAIIQLVSKISGTNNSLTINADNVMSLVTDITGMNDQGLKGMLNGIGIVGTLSNYLYVTGISPTDGTANQKVAELVPELLSAPLSVKIGYGNDGITLDVYLTHNKPEGEETFENHGGHIDLTATIKFNSEKKTFEHPDFASEIDAYKTVESDLKAAVKTQAEAQATWEKFAADFKKEYARLEEAYKSTDEYAEYSKVNSEYAEAKNKHDAKMKELEAFEEIGSNTYQKGRNFIRKYSDAYKAYVGAKGTANEDDKKAVLDTELENLKKEFATYANKDAILAKWEELKPLINDYREKEAERTKASKAYTALQQYKDYTAYQGTWRTAASTINDANKALHQVATQSFFYFNLAA